MSVKHKFFNIGSSIKEGFRDIKMVLDEGHLKLFLFPMMAVIIFGIIYVNLNNSFAAKRAHIQEELDAVQAQQNNEQAYLSNKKKLLDLEPRFPDLTRKNVWLLNEVVTIFKEAGVDLQDSPAQQEDSSNTGYTIVYTQVDMNISYAQLGNLLAAIEGREEFLKVSDVSLDKTAGKNVLGKNSVKLRINAVFPSEKVSSVLFKENKKQGGKK